MEILWKGIVSVICTPGNQIRLRQFDIWKHVFWLKHLIFGYKFFFYLLNIELTIFICKYLYLPQKICNGLFFQLLLTWYSFYVLFSFYFIDLEIVIFTFGWYFCLTLSWQRCLPYGNQYIDLLCKYEPCRALLWQRLYHLRIF